MRTGVPSTLRCGMAATILTISPMPPNQMLHLAKTRAFIPEKISVLRQILSEQPESPTASAAREDLIALLSGTNRFDDALLEYQQINAQPGAGDAIDFRLLDLMLKTGRFSEVLRDTSVAAGPT